jgi:hypothetical protein
MHAPIRPAIARFGLCDANSGGNVAIPSSITRPGAHLAKPW